MLISLLTLLILFILSVVIRFDQFENQPQGRGFYNADYSIWTNTEVNYHVLATLKVYQDYPIREHFFAPYIPNYGRYDSLVHSYATNKNHPELVVYPSFSPAVFIAPYLFFKLFHLSISYTNLQIFSLVIHLLTVVLMFFVIRAFTKRSQFSNLIAVLSASIYIFATSVLNDHMNVWWAHQLMQPVFLLVLLRFIHTKGTLKPWELLLSSFALVAINWTGLFVMLGVAVYYTANLIKTRQKDFLHRIAAICIGGITALGLIITQVLVTTNIDLGTYVEKVAKRVDSRSAEVDYIPLPPLILDYINNMIIDFGAYVFGAVALLLILYKRRYFTAKKDRFKWTVIGISCVPIIESLLLVEHDTVYGFGRLKLLIPLILFISLLTSTLLQHTKKKQRTTVVVIITIFALCATIHSVLYLNIYGNGSGKENNYQKYLPAIAEPQIPR